MRLSIKDNRTVTGTCYNTHNIVVSRVGLGLVVCTVSSRGIPVYDSGQSGADRRLINDAEWIKSEATFPSNRPSFCHNYNSSFRHSILTSSSYPQYHGHVGVLFSYYYHANTILLVEISASSVWPSWLSHFPPASSSGPNSFDPRAKISFLI